MLLAFETSSFKIYEEAIISPPLNIVTLGYRKDTV